MTRPPYEIVCGEPNTPEWLRGRKGLLGASEVACVLGLSKWSTPLQIFVDKMSDSIDDSMSEWQEWGHRLEPALAEWVSDAQGLTVLPTPGLLRSTKYPWLGATPDRVTPKGEPVELKTSDRYMESDWADGVPIHYVIQVLVQMIVLNRRRGYLAVLHGGNHPVFYVVDWDQVAVDQIIEITRAFWFDHIVPKIAPDPISSEEAVLAYQNPLDIAIEGGEDLFDMWGAYGLMQAEKVELEQQMSDIQLEIKKAMGDDGTSLTYKGKPLFTWKVRKGPTGVDAKAMAAAHPRIAKRFMRTGNPTRTFLRKTVKEVEKK